MAANKDKGYTNGRPSGWGARACRPRIFSDRFTHVRQHKIIPPTLSARDRPQSEGNRISGAAKVAKTDKKHNQLARDDSEDDEPRTCEFNSEEDK